MQRGLAIGTGLRLRFAGAALVDQVMDAFARRPAPVPDHAGTIDLWDCETTGVAPPAPPWTLDEIGALGALPTPFVGIHDPGAGRLTLVDRPARRALCCWATAALPWYERGAPLRAALHGLLTGGPLELVHAAAVGAGDRGALVAGLSGAGKTTLALACLEAGMQFAGDDYVLLGFEPRPAAHALYRTAKTVAEHGGDKDVLLLDAEALTARLPIVALVLPRRSAEHRPRAERLSAAAGLLGLAPSSVLQAPAERGGPMRAAARLVRAVPAYALHCTADSRANAAALWELIAA